MKGKYISWIMALAVLVMVFAVLTGCDNDVTTEGLAQATPTSTPTSTPTANPGPQQYLTVDGYNLELAFCDEFNGNNLNQALWSYCPAWERQDLGNMWDKKQVSVSDGNLVLNMDYGDGVYKSGAIRTINKYQQKYGYFEIRCQINQVPGFWCAFWLYCTGVSGANGSGEDGTEIDIFESAYYGKDLIGHAIHYDDDSWQGGNSIYSDSYTSYVQGIYEGYHTFSLLWTPNQYVWYIDGQEVWRLTEKDVPGGICQVPLYLKVSVETGSWTGLPDQKDMPASFLVDYVRTYTIIEE
ncbi:MAG: glycoside hydrolase family 16 protein [Clostridia bacterium]|nr:glycoside hydrolase family 16 protein [Clostridia bacterium]